MANDSVHSCDMLERCILSYDKPFSEQIVNVIKSFSTYLSVADSAYSYNASFLPVKIVRFEEFCQQAHTRYQTLEKVNAKGLLEQLWKENEPDEIALTDGMWRIEITEKTPEPTCHLAKAFWKERIKPAPQPEDVLYCLEWEETGRRQCFTISGRQAMSGFCVDPSSYGDFAQGCKQLINRITEVLKPHGEGKPSE